MTKSHFKKLPIKTLVWFAPPYFAFAFPGIIQRRHGRRGIWVNFFGDGQCFFVLRNPAEYLYVHETNQGATKK